MDTIELLKRLTKPRGVSGNEKPAAEAAAELLSEYCGETSRDNMGNLLGIVRGTNPDKRIMLEAHLDQVGFIVTEILEGGFLKFAAVGGVDARILPGLKVKIFGKREIFGVVDAPDEPPEKTSEIKDMRIFTGYEEEELKKIVRIGDHIAYDYELTELLDGNLCSGAMDNRAGMAVMLSALKRLKGKNLAADIYTMFSTQEEVGLRGSRTGAFAVRPDLAIVVDVTHGTTVDSEKDPGVFDLGSGAVILRGPSVDYDKSLELIEVAENNNIPYKIEAAGGASGTTAWAIQIAGGGVPTLLISIPLRYMHTNVEVLKTADVEAAAALTAAAVEYFSKAWEAK